jgi:UDP-3-O-[3-hydroxymyristoyl] N-acetylglucosamine deacetylase
MESNLQKTLAKPIKLQGIGLHSGFITTLILKPSLPNSGITFLRTDIKDIKKNSISATFKNVTSAKLCTKIENSFGISVSTIEHLMGAFYGEGIDNVIVEVNNIEVPIMDGSAKAFVEAIKSAGVKEQNVTRKFIKVLKRVEIKEGSKYISIEPLERKLKIDFKLIYDNELIGSQREELSVNEKNLESIYNARTFCLFEDIEKIKEVGLAKGGSLDNAIVVQGKKILNKSGLRDKNEFVKHKILDCLGDFMLSEYRMFGLIKCVRGGHQLTNDLLKKFFSDNTNWKFVSYKKEDLQNQKNFNYTAPIAVNA